MKYFSVIAVLIMLSVSPAFGEFYEYQDKNGNTVITDSPPSGVEGRKKTLQEDRVWHSTRTEKDYPAAAEHKSAAKQEEPRKKDYSRVSAVMYMTDW